MARYLKSEFFNFEFLRVLHAAPFEGSEIGECMDALLDVKDGDGDSWYRAWQTAALKSQALAEEANAAGDVEAERWCLLRSSHYLRSSETFLHLNSTDPRILSISEKAIDLFQRGISLLDSKVYRLEIPYENYKLPAYLYMPTQQSLLPGKIPLIIQTGGFDSTQEELYFFVAAGARTRGYAVLTFEGPGQGIVLRKLGKHMRADWEVVTSKVLNFVFDFSSAHPNLNLDLERLAMTGNSLGGYFTLRGAVDPRVKACISTDGMYDAWLLTDSRLPKWLTNAWESGWLKDGAFSSIFYFAAKFDIQVAWEFYHAMWVFGVESPAQVLRQFKKYSLRSGSKEYLSKVNCPVMVTCAADTLYFTPELSTDLIWKGLEHLGDKRTMWVAKGVGQGGLQAKIGAMGIAHQKMFSWLDDQFDIKRNKGAKHYLPAL